MSAVEAFANVLVAYGVAVGTQLLVFPALVAPNFRGSGDDPTRWARTGASSGRPTMPIRTSSSPAA